jgi:multicomponent Na+:H+ antiporter subunit D
VLVASSVLNAAYFLPILFRAWFGDVARRGDADARRPAEAPLAAARADADHRRARRSAPVSSPPPFSPLELGPPDRERRYGVP